MSVWLTGIQISVLLSHSLSLQWRKMHELSRWSGKSRAEKRARRDWPFSTTDTRSGWVGHLAKMSGWVIRTISHHHRFYISVQLSEERRIPVMNENVSNGVVRVWGVSGEAFHQNSCEAWISLIHKHFHMQGRAHWQGDRAHWVAVCTAGVPEKMHGGSSSAAWPPKATAVAIEKKMTITYVFHPSSDVLLLSVLL